jgi:hypothetical protein
MSLTSGKVHFMTQSYKHIYMSSLMLRKLKLTAKKSIQIKLGQKTKTVSIKRIKRKGAHLFIPPALRQELNVPKQGQCLLLSSGSNVRFGPLVGILTTTGNRSAASPFGSRSGMIRQYLRAGTNKAYYFAFTPQDINWQQETVAGYFIAPGGGWSRRIVSLPDVVYNRMANRKAEKSSSVELIKDRFVRRNIPIFNWGFFDKWDVYDLLDGDIEAGPHVPESKVNPSPEQIKDMLTEHNFVYLKPTGGSLGKGIYRLTYHPKKGYFARFRRNGKNVLMRFAKFSSLMKYIGRHKGRLNNYVIQQGIRLIEIEKCPIDFRFHLNKNASNQWVVAGIGAKKAGKGSVTTHVRSGGQLMTPEQALNRVFGDQADDMLRKTKQASIKLAEAIERKSPHLIGELGFDIGIDVKGHVWMFEANSKPGRSIFKHPSLKSQGKASLAYIFEHCLYLSRFKGRGND